MPPSRQRVRHSACLKTNPLVRCSTAMGDETSNSRGSLKAPPEQSAPRLTIQWQSDHALTDLLVTYLTTHPADCRILFYSDGKKAMSTADDGPSGSDKGQIYGTLAKLIFTNHPKYGYAYSVNAKKFRDAVCNCIGILRGAGVIPAEGMQMRNLLDAALAELPWYTELDAIWHANLSMATKTYSSKPGVDHAGALYSLIQSRGGGGPPMQFDAPPDAQHVYPGANTQPPPHAYPEHNTYPSSTLPPHYGQQYYLRYPLATPYAGGSHGDPFDAPLGDALHHLEGDERADSSSKVAGKKRQLPSSPSPPPDAPEPFNVPEKSPASAYNSRSAFRMQKPPSLHSSTTRNTTSLSDYLMSSTPQTSLPNSGGSKKKKAKPDVMQQVDEVKDELASMHSDAMSRHDHKHHRFLAKLEVKSEHNRDIKKYEWLRATHEHETSQATVSHQRLQESKDAEICLREAGHSSPRSTFIGARQGSGESSTQNSVPSNDAGEQGPEIRWRS
ncbi:uncharacterized protein EDB91DRAFT_1349938 [Suillus paluster]|uniref:uncharacterized protein n=1 Tax=Suillus paluster TaxID=48578 RepID=UPI001B8634BC|nr:uncharacterized protein EDB91DRAFT_1349938 [Suillus paluster]KAG1728965.1 hypothetical protein EDB91DRAFT_1349938 [Suillus paluster]